MVQKEEVCRKIPTCVGLKLTPQSVVRSGVFQALYFSKKLFGVRTSRSEKERKKSLGFVVRIGDCQQHLIFVGISHQMRDDDTRVQAHPKRHCPPRATIQ
jgi:hypothetical protein